MDYVYAVGPLHSYCCAVGTENHDTEHNIIQHIFCIPASGLIQQWCGYVAATFLLSPTLYKNLVTFCKYLTTLEMEKKTDTGRDRKANVSASRPGCRDKKIHPGAPLVITKKSHKAVTKNCGPPSPFLLATWLEGTKIYKFSVTLILGVYCLMITFLPYRLEDTLIDTMIYFIHSKDRKQLLQIIPKIYRKSCSQPI